MIDPVRERLIGLGCMGVVVERDSDRAVRAIHWVHGDGDCFSLKMDGPTVWPDNLWIEKAWSMFDMAGYLAFDRNRSEVERWQAAQ